MVDAHRAFERLLQLTRTLTEELPLEAALQEVTDAALALVPGDHASLRLLDDSRSLLVSGARSGEGMDQRPMAFRPGEGLIGWVVERGQSARVGDAAGDPRFVRDGEQGFSIASLLAVPMWSGGRVIGVLSVSSARGEAFAPEHELTAQVLANCAVPPIERARLLRLSQTDHHTMAFNQGYLMPRLSEEMALARQWTRPLAYLLMDLDHFKQVNDTWGHAVGDRVLREFADRMRALVRRQDVFVRRGGEEFSLIMPGTGLREAAAVAERIRATLAAHPVALPDGSTRVQTACIGVAVWDGAESPDALDQRADAAMYRAKGGGRNRVEVDGRARAGGKAPGQV